MYGFIIQVQYVSLYGFILSAACATGGFYTAHCMCHCMALYWVRYVSLYGK